ncbi:Multidrug resistance protein MdtN [Marinomonas aquimarina]|uniref:Multidrug resistance protein MdtN n=1 Tax=Marinomonas aquimarina TaxID=295068 RepID=A0A1A8T933_9GAMM|nr:HlyD family efflux transporter periplasmic adaptor subunit [Marinomonas aquimarina]SBS28089.1 Multidrug resistance protein MdtN [Marinomonas aquimarina]
MGLPALSTVLIGIGLLLHGCQSQPDHIALGTLERDSLILSALVSQQIVELPVTEGQKVSQGQLLARFKDDSAQAQLDYAEAQLRLAQATLAELQNGTRPEQIDSAYAAWQGALANDKEALLQLQRTQELYQANAIGRAALDNARTFKDQTRAQAEQLQQGWLELRNGAREEVLQQRQAQVEAAQAQVRIAKESLNQHRITAPSSGLIDLSPWHQGDSVLAGTQVFRLLTDEPPYARVYLPETLRTQLQTGSQVQILIDGVDQPFRGVVRTIRSQPAFTPYFALNENERSRLMYLAKIDVQDAEAIALGTPLEVRLP